MMQCPYEECGRQFIVPWEKKDELMKCPFCSQPVFADRVGLVHIEDGIAPESLPPTIQPYKTSKIELSCLGNAGSGYIHAQVRVVWYEPEIHAERRELVLKARHLPIRNFYRKERVNYCWFDVPEDFLCLYCRCVQIKPRLEEWRCFYMKDGQFHDMGEPKTGVTSDFFERFYPQCKKWTFTITG